MRIPQLHQHVRPSCQQMQIMDDVTARRLSPEAQALPQLLVLLPAYGLPVIAAGLRRGRPAGLDRPNSGLHLAK